MCSNLAFVFLPPSQGGLRLPPKNDEINKGKAFFTGFDLAQANLKLLLDAIVSEAAPLLTSPSRSEDVGKLTTAELRHCIRMVRKKSQPSYRIARDKARQDGGLSSESSADAMWRGAVDTWQPSERLVKSTHAFGVGTWNSFRTSWRSDYHRGKENFLTGRPRGSSHDSSDSGGRGFQPGRRQQRPPLLVDKSLAKPAAKRKPERPPPLGERRRSTSQPPIAALLPVRVVSVPEPQHPPLAQRWANAAGREVTYRTPSGALPSTAAGRPSSGKGRAKGKSSKGKPRRSRSRERPGAIDGPLACKPPSKFALNTLKGLIRLPGPYKALEGLTTRPLRAPYKALKGLIRPLMAL